MGYVSLQSLKYRCENKVAAGGEYVPGKYCTPHSSSGNTIGGKQYGTQQVNVGREGI